jgi:hypothetical protein
MRIVRHPNIVQLKAFYYSNGERVRILRRGSWAQDKLTISRKMRSTSILSRNLFLRQYIEPHGSSTR